MSTFVSYLAKVRAGDPPTSDEAIAFLQWFHARHPGATARHFAKHRTLDGRTSYEVLAMRAAPRVAADATVLDVACGDGVSTAELARALPRASVVGLDVSSDDLALARLRVPTARFVCAPAQRTGLADASIDGAVCHCALMLMNDGESLVTELARVLRPGAAFTAINLQRLNIATFSPPLAALLDEMLRRDLPAYPRLGIGDVRLSSPEGIAALFRPETGFTTTIDAESVTLPTPCDVAAMLDLFRGHYWFDMLTDDSRATFEARAPGFLESAADEEGLVPAQSELLIVTVTRVS
jgi:SAM-dependent methyltransferase